MNGVPSALQYNVGASIPPGDYTLKLAVVEGDRVGTIEHEIHAALVDAPPVKLSELMVGGPIGRAAARSTDDRHIPWPSAASTATSKRTAPAPTI